MRKRVGSSPTTLKNENSKREKNKGGIYKRSDRKNSEKNGGDNDRGDGREETKII